MRSATFAAAIDRDGRRIIDAGTLHLDAPVPACPGWAVRDVVGHLGRVHRSVADIVETRAVEAPAVAPPAPPEGDEVLTYFAEGLDRLLRALATTAPDTPVYTWTGAGVAAFYFRRMAHETAVHRYDAQAAAHVRGDGRAEPDPFDAELAADAIAELYDVVLPFAVQRRRIQLPAASLHVHRTDGPGEWLLRNLDGRLEVDHEHAKADVAVRGAAPDLLVFLWNRGRPDTLEVFGDDAAATAWAALAP